MTITWDFPPVSIVRRKRGHCPVCGRRAERSRTFTHTISPFHSAVTLGMDLRAAERAVRDAVQAEADAWEPDFTHAACSERHLTNEEPS